MKCTQSMTRVVQDIGPWGLGMAFSLAIGKVYTHKHTKFAQHVKHPGIILCSCKHRYKVHKDCLVTQDIQASYNLLITH